jgi:fatty-acyl-CoA synthase
VPCGVVGEPGARLSSDAGVFRHAEATAAAIDERGFLHTGDLATMDERGYVRIVGRLKDMLIVGGNPFPVEIESVLLEHSGGDAAVIGARPDWARSYRLYASGRARPSRTGSHARAARRAQDAIGLRRCTATDGPGKVQNTCSRDSGTLRSHP